MKTIIAIFALSASVGVTAYHVTDPEKAPLENTMTEVQQPVVIEEPAWSAPHLRPPVPLSLVAPVRAEQSESHEFETELAASTVSHDEDKPQATVGSKFKSALDSVFQFAVATRMISPPEENVLDLEKPCLALKPARTPHRDTVVIRARAASQSVEAIPVASIEPVAASAENASVQSSPEPSRAMPMARPCCPPRRARTASAIDRHLRPGVGWR